MDWMNSTRLIANKNLFKPHQFETNPPNLPNMSGGAEEQISLFRSRVELRRFDDGTLRILESILISKDVKSLLEVRSSLREFTRRESLCIIREIADKSVEHKLFILEFLVRAFALVGDIEAIFKL
ncbi:hypothetical protein HYC85_031629 [Camellia sinensis]|uniref:MI domain-containing protein n=1 Tax=Camellia sinensis TaxID=4442 RepID=A0A7J7FUQ0_CAMSI|nr:hypothetical protein HYC85_031629 [Camellia sinensis]